ncbi:MAG: GH92 family glycosyl hydrolase [Planctomycetes bacterium]|nr:GH92 family glycosyl hydrolase [Planctomycetota bacterium]
MTQQSIINLPRRDFLKACMTAAGAAAVSSLMSGCASESGFTNTGRVANAIGNTPALGRFAGQVRPIVGTGWHGHTFPGATAPFGLVQLSPDTVGPPEPKWNGKWDIYDWDHCGGYHYPDNTILGISHTHISGTGVQEMGDVLVMPLIQDVNWGWNSGAPGKEHQAQIQALGSDTGWVSRDGHTGYASRFSHQQEIVRAGYYAVYLQTPKVKAEVTAATRSGMHRYTYPALPDTTRRGLIVDLVHGLGNAPYHAEITIESPTRISGKRYSHGWAKNRQAYFVMEFSAPIKSYDVMVDGRVTSGLAPQPKHFSATEIKAIFQWDHETVNHEHPLLIRVGISGTGIEGAAKNLSAEISHWDFDSLEQQTQQVWNEALGVLEADLPTTELAQTFYSSAYHGMMGPTTFNDVDGTFRGEDFKNHRNPGFTNYTTMSIWDIYRGEFPFIMLTQPHRTNDIINTTLTDYRQLNKKTLPMWPLWANETWCMTGFHVVGMIVGAYTRGFRGYNVPALYAAMRETALVGATANGIRKFQEQFRRYGYIPTEPRKGSVSRSLDLAYDYWCVGAMAELLGKHDDAAMFYKLGQNYKKLFDPSTGFMRGKNADGKWREPFHPDDVYASDYTESDAWQATFNVMQDIQGLIDLYGGDQQFIAKLDAFFTAPSNIPAYDIDITGMVGQDDQGDEPTNHISYLYPFAGAAWKTQYWSRKVLALYNNTPNGIPGNDDIGQTSSCFTLGAMGFYPVNPATGVYVIGSPLINRVKIHNSVARTTL